MKPKVEVIERIIKESTLGAYALNKEWNEELAQAIADALEVKLPCDIRCDATMNSYIMELNKGVFE